jgi:hypothetical protein
MALRFLNVDLDVVTPTKPLALIRHFKMDGVVLNSTDTGAGFLTTFEVSGETKTPAKVLAGFKKLFAELSPKAQEEWAAAKNREFNFGYEETKQEDITEIGFPPPFVAFAASVKATIALTIYHQESEQE